ncbi:Nucleotide-binding universal stress protein, UspA family [Thermomonospora echinospora]|uniref:Nucleotide-binding universal stress protein, UspA family n=1 Tax=Thermomonospora echinospora TaxID=1992 RepID=A0A1H6D478_9ACTN|nr:universal stress protein [Thermomonospora echinospora]SEG80132.1 Nucleotide-binding universal stress protein, UspA family [Thermomonospora echinospora]
MIGEHVLTGYSDDSGGREALECARAIVALTGGRLTVATVHPPGRAGAAAEAGTTLRQAAGLLDEEPADYLAQESRGVGRGLSVLAGKVGADLIVIGSAAGGARGQITIGSAADHLLHASSEAVLITPAGYTPPERLQRITVAYVRRPQCDEAVERTAVAAARLGVPLRLLTLALDEADSGRLRDDLALAVPVAAGNSGLEPSAVQTALAEGGDVAAALARTDWEDGELLVCASSEDSAVHRVFLGEVALKVLRAAPCPVAVLPRGRN